MLAIFLILSACQAIVPTSSSDDFDFKSMEADEYKAYEDDYDDYDHYDYSADYDDYGYNEGLQITTGSGCSCGKKTVSRETI